MNKPLLVFIPSIILAVQFMAAQSDPCSGATTITVNSSCVTQSYNVTSSFGADVTPSCGNAGRDGWYKFTLASAQTVTITATTNRNLVLALYTGSCGSLTEVACENSGGSGTTETLVASLGSGTYFLQVHRVNTNPNDMTGNICVYTSASAPANDNCSGSMALTSGSSCTYTNVNSAGATNSGVSATCGSGPDDDVWFSFVAVTSSHTVNVAGSASYDAVLQVFSGSCGSLTSIGCVDASLSGGTESVTVTGLTPGATYYIRVFDYGTGAPSTTTFDICVVTNTPPANDNCSGAFNLVSNSSCSYTSGTSLNGTLSTPAATCGSNADDDVWYMFTATNTQHQVNVTGASNYNAVLEVYSGTCGSLTSMQCVNSTGQGNTETVNLSGLTVGQTYYIRVFHNGAGSSSTPTFNICVVDGNPCTLGSGATTVGSLPYSITGQTTCGAVNDLTSSNVTGYCGASYYYDGEDAVYVFTPTTTGQVDINLTSASGSYTGLMLHDGCPTAGGGCIGYNQSSSGTKSLTVCVTAGITYYLIIDSWPSPACNPYNLSISAPYGSGAPANDLICNATLLSLGVPVTGDNFCASASGEPAVPGCWTTGNRNTVWYSVVCPASGTLKIKTAGSSLHNTQIAVYSGTCSSLTYVNCNDDATGCGSSSDLSSELSLTGLTAGATYYIAVDGNDDEMGTFSIVAVDGSSPYPIVSGQECVAPNPVCNATFTVSNPGYGGYGFTCDLPSSYCLASAERSVVWYSIPINAAGTLVFDLVPNDFNCSSQDETDYDFAIWKTTGSGSVTCTQIFNGAATPLRCNYSYLGVTGMNPGGNAPSSLSATVCPTCSPCPSYSPTSYYDAAYEDGLTVSSGEVYLLAISNYSNSTSGFHIDFRTSPIGYVGSTATSVTWTGGDPSVPTVWTDADNWGGCNSPACTIDATVAPFSNQPVLTTGTTFYAKDVTVQPGATLTLQANSTLEICGSFTNYGTLVMAPTSTLRFVGSATQNLVGALTGTNMLGKLEINKTGGQVNLQSDVDMSGYFYTINGTSIFNTNQHYVKVGGIFNNFNGNSTYTNTGTAGTLEFNGTGPQFYNQGASQLDLNFVVMNNSGSGVTLSSDMFIKSSTGTLTLTNGIISTGSNRVDVANGTATSVSTGNTNSYISGNLYRTLSGSAGSYDFPLGTSSSYQRANITFTTATTIPRIQSRFDSWPSGPNTQGGTECSTTYNLPSQNNGYWTLTASANPTSGTYNCTLYPTGATNTAGANGWTVEKSSVVGGPWILNGTCAASTVAVVNRTGMNGFSVFGVAQATNPLPIELLSFTGHSEGEQNLLEWVTATELNNDYFTVERSVDGILYEEVGRTPGAGNSNMELSYMMYDPYPYYPLTYYRLKQTDYNGEYSYSPMISISNQNEGGVEFGGVYPNPSEGIFNVKMYSSGNYSITISIVDIYGHTVYTENRSLTMGEQTLMVDGHRWASGVYFIHIISSNKQLNVMQKVIRK